MRTVVATTKVVNFKQITTASAKSVLPPITVVATTKVVNFKQIITKLCHYYFSKELLLLFLSRT